MAVASITVIATCVVAVASVAGLLVAILGLQTWRTQLEGTAHFDLARRLLLAVYELRDAIDNVRHPFLSSGEAAGGDPDTPWQIAAYENRWTGVRAAMVQLQAATREADVCFGRSLWDRSSSICQLRSGDLFDAVSALADIERGASDAAPLTKEQRAVSHKRHSTLLTGIGWASPWSRLSRWVGCETRVDMGRLSGAD
jgi:hypothetical protein